MNNTSFLKSIRSLFSLSPGTGHAGSLKFFILICVSIGLASGASAQASRDPQTSRGAKAPYKVAILPVDIHSPESLGYMREGLWDMLASRVELEGRVAVIEKGPVKKALSDLSGEIDTDSARKIGQALGADFVLFGSLTKLGDSASLDLKVLEVGSDKPGSSVFIQAKRMEEIVMQVDVLARRVDEKILGYSLSPPVEKPAVAGAEPPRDTAALPAPPPGFRSMTPPMAAPGAAPAGFWQSTPFSFRIKGMAMGDLDGDGKPEIVMIDERDVWIYRYDKGFNLLKKLEGVKQDHYMAVDVAEIKKDGKAQVFVTNLQGDEGEWSPRQLKSFVVAYVDGQYKVVSSDLDWFLRVIDWEGRGPVLLGQKRGYQTSFEASIFEMGWDGKAWKETRKLSLSNVFCIYGFTPFVHDGKTLYAFIDSDFRLKAVDQTGKIIWRSTTQYGSTNVFRVKHIPSGVGYYEGDDLAWVNVRVVARGDEILILRNISPIADIFKRQKYYSGGEVQSLIWNGAMFMERWKSVEIPGNLIDFQTQPIPGALEKELIVAVNLPKDSFLSFEANSALMVSRVQ